MGNHLTFDSAKELLGAGGTALSSCGSRRFLVVLGGPGSTPAGKRSLPRRSLPFPFASFATFCSTSPFPRFAVSPFRRFAKASGWAFALLLTALAAAPAPRTDEYTHGHIAVRVTASPPQVELDKDVLVTFAVTAPSEIEVQLPSLHDRLQGFAFGGSYDDEPAADRGAITRVRHVRLTPLVATEYRVAPAPILYTDRSSSPPKTGWFPTRPLVFEAVLPAEGRDARDIDGSLSPVWISPSARTVTLSVLAVLGAATLFAAGWFGLRRVRRRIRLARMSPRERALEELAILLAQDLAGRNRVKEFYLELTRIVREYIERAHRIRAPEQTTEEFLAAAARNPIFPETVLGRLRSFLEAADLVKFAAHRPPPDAIRAATDTAREYIVTDTASSVPVSPSRPSRPSVPSPSAPPQPAIPARNASRSDAGGRNPQSAISPGGS